MNVAKFYEAVALAHSAAHGATCAASYANIDNKRAEEFALHAEAAAYAVLDALAMAQLSVATAKDWQNATGAVQ